MRKAHYRIPNPSFQATRYTSAITPQGGYARLNSTLGAEMHKAVFSRSKAGLLAALFAMAAMLCGSIAMAYIAHDSFFNHSGRQSTALIASLFSCSFFLVAAVSLYYFYRELKNSSPRVVLDENGIHCSQLPNGFISWANIFNASRERDGDIRLLLASEDYEKSLWEGAIDRMLYRVVKSSIGTTIGIRVLTIGNGGLLFRLIKENISLYHGAPNNSFKADGVPPRPSLQR